MPRTNDEILAGCVSAADAEAIVAARAACDRIAERVRYVETNSAGRIWVVADHAEEALFELLNYAASHGYCAEAARAMDRREVSGNE